MRSLPCHSSDDATAIVPFRRAGRAFAGSNTTEGVGEMTARKSLLALACASLSACTTMNGMPTFNGLPMFGGASSESISADNVGIDPCSESERQREAMGKSIAGAVVGALVGTLVGAILDGVTRSNNHVFMKVGALAGLTIGAVREYNNAVDTYRRQCDVFRSAQAKNAEVGVATFKEGSNIVGEIVVAPSDGFFYPNSDRLTPEGIAYFEDHARQYTIEVQLASYEATMRAAGSQDPKLSPLSTFSATADQKREIQQRWLNMRIVLTGHTDDEGDATDAQALSELRAKNVADVFHSVGVPESSLMYQGAGSALPIADNSTADGRARNNRVDVAVFYDERTIAPYQEARSADHRLFSKVPAAPKPQVVLQSAPPSTAPKPQGARQSPPPSTAGQPKATSKPAASSSTVAEPARVDVGLDFGGQPVPPGNASVIADLGKLQPSNSTVSLAAIFGIASSYADNALAVPNCFEDDPGRYRMASVKRLSDNSELRGKPPISLSESYLGILKRSYSAPAADHFVEVKNLTIKKNGQLAEQPEFNVFKEFQRKSQDERRKTGAPDLSTHPIAFSVRGEHGVLVRQFFEKEQGLICMDFVIPNDQKATQLQRSALVYTHNGVRKVATLPLKL